MNKQPKARARKISNLQMQQMRTRSNQANKLVERVTRNLDTYTAEAAARIMVRDIEHLLWEMLGSRFSRTSRDVLTEMQKAHMIKRLRIVGHESTLIKKGKTVRRAQRVGKTHNAAHDLVRSLVHLLGRWARPRALTKPVARFEHEGGGTTLVCKTRYPSDDSYFDHVTGRRYEVCSTIDAHFQMPHWAKSLKVITKIPGVNPKVKELR